jgi:hypothetical protein
MSAWTATIEKLREGGLYCEAWGIRGERAAADLENALSVKLPSAVATFVEELGNLRIDPFDVCIAGDSAGTIGAVAATKSLQETSGEPLPLDCMQIMEHAGEVYILRAATGAVAAYEALRVVQGHETLEWACFKDFLDWVVVEAQRFQYAGDLGL